MSRLRAAWLFAFAIASCSPGGLSDEEAARAIEATTIDVSFEETPIVDVLALVERESGVPARFAGGVAPHPSEEAWHVTFSADAVRARDVLDLVCRIKQLSWSIEDGTVVVRSDEGPTGTMVLDLHDVKDMTVPPQSYLPDKWGAEGGAFDLEDPDLCFEGDALADLIRETIDTSVWTSGGEVSFREGGVLIVKAPQGTHSRIRRLLEGIRAAIPR